MTYDPAPMGVSPSLLNKQRRAAAEAAAPACGTAGQSIDLFFAIEEAVSGTVSDPAVAAHAGPICQWALAAWESWLPRGSLLRLAAFARRRLTKARNPWAVVTGPAASFVASATRLGWTVRDAFSVTTDDGVDIRLDRDPPAVLQRAVAHSVQRWRWRRVELAFPQLHHPSGHVGVDRSSIVKLLRSRRNGDEWHAGARAGLRSTIVGRQWPQTRLFAASLAVHNRCCLCLHRILVARGLRPDQAALVHQWLARVANPRHQYHRGPLDVDEVVNLVSGSFDDAIHEAMIDPSDIAAALREAPVGSLMHRIWRCPSLEDARVRLAPAQFLDDMRSDDPPCTVSTTRALFPSLLHLTTHPPTEETFEWVVAPADGSGSVVGTVYSDASAVDNRHHDLRRLGWSFVVLDGEGQIIAIACGRPPAWIRDVPGAEAWALLQALTRALPGTVFRIDCLLVTVGMQRGRRWATSAQRPLARVFGLLHSAADDFPPSAFVWMPSHKGKSSVGRVRLSDGSFLTERDRRTNDIADHHAKVVANRERVSEGVRERIDAQKALSEAVARWVGMATHLSSHQPSPVPRDTTASLRRTRGIRAARGSAPRPRRRPVPPRLVEVRPPSLGGHVIVHDPRGARCLICRRYSKCYEKFARARCDGSAAARWAERAVADAEHGLADGGGHRRMMSGEVIWCARCGSYASELARGLARPCLGPPPPGGNSGGRLWQLRRLRKGRHPVTGAPLPHAIPEDCWDLASHRRVPPAPPPHCPHPPHQQQPLQQPQPQLGSHLPPVPPPVDRRSRDAVDGLTPAGQRLAALRRRVAGRAAVDVEPQPEAKRPRLDAACSNASILVVATATVPAGSSTSSSWPSRPTSPMAGNVDEREVHDATKTAEERSDRHRADDFQPQHQRSVRRRVEHQQHEVASSSAGPELTQSSTGIADDVPSTGPPRKRLRWKSSHASS